MSSLSDLDPNYKQKSLKFSDEEKKEYCFELIDRFQKIVSKNRNFLSERLKKEFADLIRAAQEEIKRLEEKNDFS